MSTHLCLSRLVHLSTSECFSDGIFLLQSPCPDIHYDMHPIAKWFTDWSLTEAIAAISSRS